MPGKHKEPTIAFRPSAWERAIIEQRAALSGMHKKDFIARSCIYSNIVVVGKKEKGLVNNCVGFGLSPFYGTQ